MPYDPTRHHRRSIRLKGYDYTQPGAYFVTLVTHERMPLFGEIVNGEMRLNDIGRVAERCWLDIPSHFPHVALDAFVIMPNHVHGILWIVESPPETPEMPEMVGAKNFSPLPPPSSAERPRGTSKTIGSIVRGVKIGVTQWVRQNTDIYIVWQRNYYDRIIRNERALNAIRRYILENPLRWHLDRENPACTGPDPLAQAIWAMFREDDADHPNRGDL
jgi:putative transposase